MKLLSVVEMSIFTVRIVAVLISPLRKRSLARRRLSRAWGAGAGEGAGAASEGVSRRHANTQESARMTDWKREEWEEDRAIPEHSPGASWCWIYLLFWGQETDWPRLPGRDIYSLSPLCPLVTRTRCPPPPAAPGRSPALCAASPRRASLRASLRVSAASVRFQKCEPKTRK